METKLCECGCGTPARPGKRFARYHRVFNGRALIWDGFRYVLRYRLVMEQHIGRTLSPVEVVHHINNNPMDDRIENLVLCADNAEHKRLYHNSKTLGEFTCAICGRKHTGEKRKKYHFCSRECWKKWKSPGRPQTTGKGAMITFSCERCGKTVTRKGFSGRRFFCSKGCYWTAMRGQTGQVKTNSRLIEYNGESLPLAEWSRKLGLSFKTLHSRVVQYKWDVERAFTTPARNRGH